MFLFSSLGSQGLQHRTCGEIYLSSGAGRGAGRQFRIQRGNPTDLTGITALGSGKMQDCKTKQLDEPPGSSPQRRKRQCTRAHCRRRAATSARRQGSAEDLSGFWSSWEPLEEEAIVCGRKPALTAPKNASFVLSTYSRSKLGEKS